MDFENNTSIDIGSHIGNSQFCKNKYLEEIVPTLVTKEILKNKIEETFDGLKFKKAELLVKAFSPSVTVSQDNKSYITGENFTDAAKVFPLIVSKFLFKKYPNMTDNYVLSFMGFFSSYVVIANTFQYLNLQNYIKKLVERLPNFKYEQLYYVTFMSFMGSLYKDQGESAIEEKILPLFIEYLDSLSQDEFNHLFANYQNYLLKKEIKKLNNQQGTQSPQQGGEESNNFKKPINISYQVPLDENNMLFSKDGNKSPWEIYKKQLKLYEFEESKSNVPAWFSTLILYNCSKNNHFGRLQTLLSQHSKKPGQVHLIKEINKGTRDSLYLHALTVASDNHDNNNKTTTTAPENIILGYGLGGTITDSRNHSITDSLLRILHDKKKI